MIPQAFAGFFSGLPLGWQALFTIDLALITILFCWMLVLFSKAIRWLRAGTAQPVLEGPEDTRYWVFLVPALNEESVIADSIERLLRVEAERKLIVVINDGSTDATGAQIERFADQPDVLPITRALPNAQKGKAAALNDVYLTLTPILSEREVEREDVIVGIVDADGQLEPHAPRSIARHFEDPRVGGVQIIVRIYNRSHLLARMQDVEFAVFGFLFQGGRSAWGTAGMGGSGQFNRLTALDAISDASGPWRNRLTEDQDLGLRLVSAGFKSRQDLDVHIGQQGLSNLRRLCRQRVRWAQGNLECLSLASACVRAPLPLTARVDLLVQMLMPLWQTFVGVGIIGALWLAITGQAGFLGSLSLTRLGFLYMLAFGGVLLGCVARGYMYSRGRGMLRGLLVAQIYAIYSWILWPVLVGSLSRHFRGQTGWSKTEREPLEGGPPVSS